MRYRFETSTSSERFSYGSDYGRSCNTTTPFTTELDHTGRSKFSRSTLQVLPLVPSHLRLISLIPSLQVMVWTSHEPNHYAMVIFEAAEAVSTPVKA